MGRLVRINAAAGWSEGRQPPDGTARPANAEGKPSKPHERRSPACPRPSAGGQRWAGHEGSRTPGLTRQGVRTGAEAGAAERERRLRRRRKGSSVHGAKSGTSRGSSQQAPETPNPSLSHAANRTSARDEAISNDRPDRQQSPQSSEEEEQLKRISRTYRAVGNDRSFFARCKRSRSHPQ